jgi:hypothetical protein
VLLRLASQTVMGVAMGLTFPLMLTLIDKYGVVSLIDHSSDPGTAMLVFVGTLVVTFAIGATLTGPTDGQAKKYRDARPFRTSI